MSGIINKIKLILTDYNHRQEFIIASKKKLGISYDKTQVKYQYRFFVGKKLNLKNPKTFNEKLNWIKLNYRRNIMTKMVDKYEVRSIIEQTIGEQYLIPLIGVYDKFDDIDFDKLPNRFVIKCNHDSGSTIICNDKTKFDINNAREIINKCLKINFGKKYIEWPYMNVKPRIIIEEFIEDDLKPELRVYKVFNFNGNPKIIQMINGDKTEHEYINYYDIDWNLLKLKQNYPNGPIDEKPICLKEILELAKQLSKEVPFVRTDFYVVNEKIIFSEFTFFSDAGIVPFEPKEWDEILGSWIKLPNKTREDKMGKR